MSLNCKENYPFLLYNNTDFLCQLDKKGHYSRKKSNSASLKRLTSFIIIRSRDNTQKTLSSSITGIGLASAMQRQTDRESIREKITALGKLSFRFIAIGGATCSCFGTGTIFTLTNHAFTSAIPAQVSADSHSSSRRDLSGRRFFLLFRRRCPGRILQWGHGRKIHAADENKQAKGRPNRNNCQNRKDYLLIFHIVL